jgi:zinc protease
MTEVERVEQVTQAVNKARGKVGAAPALRYLGEEPFGPSIRVHRFELDNGLTVLVEIDAAAPVVSLQTWMKVGSRFEKAGKTGISHLFEHLMFGETETTAHGAFDRQIEEAGGETNAGTFLDWTYYHQNLPKEALVLGLRLEAERLGRLVLREPQVASEKEVVANERRQRVDDDVDGFASEALYREAFKVHTYGIPTIGSMEDILSFTPDDCTAFYKTYYAPNNATLVLVGDVDLQGALDAITEHFGKLTPSEIPVEDPRPEPPQTEERRLSFEKPTPTEKLSIGYKAPALGDFDHAPLVVLSEILFGGRSSRMHRKLVHTQEIATDVRGWVGTFRDPGLFDIGLVAREEVEAEALLAAFDAELERVVAEPVTEAELEKAKAKLELGALQGLETVSGRAENIGFYETVLGLPDAYFDKVAAYRRVTRSDLLRVARRYLVKEARTIVFVHPSGEEPEGESDDEEEAA